MATPSPSQSINSTDTGVSQPAASAASASASAPPSTAPISRLHRVDAPAGPKTLRGLNKPKCIQCGNVARSRCPYQSCKSCCSKAQNPCYIHVLKQTATVPDKAPSAGSPKVDEQSNEPSPSGPSHRVPSYRQLSSQFSQFNNLNLQQSRKPLTRKEAFAINEWRFAKLKEYRERDIEAENDAFDRYIQNIRLLEDVLSAEELYADELIESNLEAVAEESNEVVVSRLKLRLKSNSVKAFNAKDKLRDIVDKGLRQFLKRELNVGDYDIQDFQNQKRRAKSLRDDRARALNDLLDKMNKARTMEDLEACMELKSQLFKQLPKKHQMELDPGMTSEGKATYEAIPDQQASISIPKLVKTVNIDQETLSSIDLHFASLEHIGL
uniref:Uncharacterized protein n=1 Tax=Kalanchoe fedtschenkoi TaxID=63787 RepID=A0A7N0RAF2_KALFE